MGAIQSSRRLRLGRQCSPKVFRSMQDVLRLLIMDRIHCKGHMKTGIELIWWNDGSQWEKLYEDMRTHGKIYAKHQKWPTTGLSKEILWRRPVLTGSEIEGTPYNQWSADCLRLAYRAQSLVNNFSLCSDRLSPACWHRNRSNAPNFLLL